MAGSLHLQICKAMVAVLTAANGTLSAGGTLGADGGIHSGRRGRAMAEQFKRQVHVYLDASPVERAQLGGMPDDWKTRIRIECCARADGLLTGEENADDLATQCYALLQADPSIGGLAMDLTPLAMAWDTEEGDVQVGVVQLVFDVQHRTAWNSIAA